MPATAPTSASTSSPTSAPAVAPATSTGAVPASAPTAAPATTPTAAPPLPSPSPVSASATAAPSATAAAVATPRPARRFVVQPEASKLTLAVNEQLANFKLPNDAILTTSAITGQMTVSADGAIGPDSRFTVDFNTIKSDDSDRDDDVRDNIIETKKFPTGTFVPKELRGLPKPIPASGPIRGQLAGDLTVHGVTRPVVFDLDGTLDNDTFKGKGRTEVKLTDFGMKIPTLAFLLRVDELVRAEVEITARAG